jgi:O-antigen/teichoic acid export membrane protein
LRVRDAVAIDAVVAAVQVGLLFVLARMQVLSVASAYAVIGLACLLACLGWLVCRRRMFGLVRSQVAPDWSRNWSFGKWGLLTHFMSESATYFVPWVVVAMLGEGETGLLAAASTLVGLTTVFISGLGNVLGPRAALAYSGGHVDALVRVLARFAAVLAVGLGAFAAGIAVFGDDLGALLYGHNYMEIGTLAAVLACADIAHSMRMTVGIGLWSIERPRAPLAADAFGLVVTIAVTVVGLRRFGLLGAPIGMFSGALAGAVVAAIILGRSLQTLRRETGATLSSVSRHD